MNPFEYIIVPNYKEMSSIASEKIISTMKLYPNALYCFAGGDTPVGTLELLVSAHNEKRIDLKKAYYIGLDEWVGLDESDEGSCIDYMKRNLFEPANIPEDHIHFFNAKDSNLDEECKLADAFIHSHGGITLSLLGVGVNGHLGFNEPGSNLESLVHIVELSDITKEVAVKYFSKEANVSQGLTVGLKQLLNSKYLILEANGKTKKAAIQKLMEDKVTLNWPVTTLRLHKNCTVIVNDVG
ncbi:glucosamine-6-phosphate deaminase [Marinilactibacillus sp. XAAS-LB27]|uniref:glucosamine-6-phosphate deaminase n=1 Tax=Marinilactibacillus sp. XAAS-LB27 TaxID=3114538 RepID=UPI002E19E1A8|nr:glucosamine-6-phosphate deaminase [Marinilactibacillus sp. XAAS-LB27]